MKWNKKWLFVMVMGIFTIGLLSGCVEEEQIEKDTKTPMLQPLQGNSISFAHEVEGSTLETSYDLGEYKLEDWRITDSKSIQMNVKVKDLKQGTEILVEHVHADMSIRSTSAQLNGMTQDSMDNSYHGTSQDGFFINQMYPYSNIFAIEGFSKDIISGWSFYAGSYGQGEITSSRLTEGNLVAQGTYGSQLSVVYNLLIKNQGETKYHVVSVEDRVIIPTAKQPMKKVATK